MTGDHLDEFRRAIADAGLTPPPEIHSDGRLHRFAANGKPTDDAGWYVLHLDGVPAGSFGDWRTGLAETWRANLGRRLSPDEQAAHRARVAAMRQQREAEGAQRKADARETAAAIWDAASAAPADHAYLVAKVIQPHGLREHDGRLLVPLRDGADLHSLQFIAADGGKLFLTGGRVAGCYFGIGKPDGVLHICEGFATGASIREATGGAVAVAFNAGNLLAVATALRAKYPDALLILCADDDAGTAGNPGLTKAREAAEAIGGTLAVPDFGDNRPDGASDFNDVRRHAGLAAVRANIERAALDSGPPVDLRAESDKFLNDAATITRLSALDPLAYDRARKAAAEALNVSVSALDEAVKKQRGESRPDDGQGRAITFEAVEPWPDVVDGAALLDELAALGSRHLILPDNGAVILALWATLTWLADRVRILPLLAITSPEKGCGKTTVLELLGHVCRRARSTSNISAAALFRFVEKYSPTLLIDEGDSFLKDNEELRGILNSGHTRTSAFVIRTTGDDHEPREFSTWCPKAIAAIGWLPDTIIDRSIRVPMRRKGPGELVEPMPDETDAFVVLRRKLARFAADRGESIAKARPELPAGLVNRRADNWRVLVAIAEAAGGRWPVLARGACQSAVAAEGEDDSLRVGLLADLRGIFSARGTDRLASAEIIEALTAMAERPWIECNRGKVISTRQLAKWLREFQIVSGSVRIASGTAKGYRLEQFGDAFSRYLPPENPAQRHNVDGARVSGDSKAAHADLVVPEETWPEPNDGAGCAVVPEKNPPRPGGEDARTLTPEPESPLDDTLSAAASAAGIPVERLREHLSPDDLADPELCTLDWLTNYARSLPAVSP